MELAHDPRFPSGILPAANRPNARELSAFFEACAAAELNDAVFEPRTVRRATGERSYFEIDFTLGLPASLRLGFMLGGKWLSLSG
jgi:hypothetical protein